MSVTDRITVVGARQHNLKGIDVVLPKNRLIVVTGLSGSGKSSLAFDTIFAEGQRRYVESLSAYAKQFLPLMDKPDVERIDGLMPSIAIEQRAPSHNPRSTVGTVTEIYDYLRLLFARTGTVFCPRCNLPIRASSAQQIVAEVFRLFPSRPVTIAAPVVRSRIGTYHELLDRVLRNGFVRVRIDGTIYDLERDARPALARYRKHSIDVIVDRVTVEESNRSRITDAVETALRQAEGVTVVFDGVREEVFSEHFACTACGYSLPHLEPRMFSFNSPFGACPDCSGLGSRVEVDPRLVVPDPTRSLEDGALEPWANPVTTRTHRWKGSWRGYYAGMVRDVCRRYRIPMDVPFAALTRQQQHVLLHGDGEFEGVITNMNRRYRETESDYVREEIYHTYMRRVRCPSCGGARLKPESLAVRIPVETGMVNIAEFSRLSVAQARAVCDGLRFPDREREIARQLLREIVHRLDFLLAVGMDYITLDRETATLAGGEAQRIHLATQIGSGLTGVLYVLDEPTVGLHPRDTERLVNALCALRDLGNTLIVVEHDESVIRRADWLVDLGPGAGVHGGRVMISDTVANALQTSSESLTVQYLTGSRRIPVPQRRRSCGPEVPRLRVEGASQFNLQNIDVGIPLGRFVCVTGVSGSGKSTLVNEILFKGLARKLNRAADEPGRHRRITGADGIDKVIDVDQSPIGRTPRSNPATYTRVFTAIRELFAMTPEARRRGYSPGRFSFNVKGGRCENCEGDGALRIEMQFMPDVYVTCDVCGGRRFNEETLTVTYRGKNIADVLAMSVEEALAFFQNIPKVRTVLSVLNEVGLGYVSVGQAATTLSGGEAQRIKLAAELCKRSTGRTLYILDEPTTGLHFADVEKLLGILHRLVDRGNTVLVIEHNMEVVKTADWVVDLGPEGGAGGGRLVGEGDPETLARTAGSHTGRFLARALASA